MSIELNSNSSTLNLSQTFSAPKLSTEQKDTISSILSEYDSSALSEQDAKEIVQALQDAGIRPSKDFANTLEAAGFDAREIGDLAGVSPPQRGGDGALPISNTPPPGGGNSASVNQENIQLLQSILEQYTDLSNLSAQEEQELSDILLEAGLLEPGALINTQS